MDKLFGVHSFVLSVIEYLQHKAARIADFVQPTYDIRIIDIPVEGQEVEIPLASGFRQTEIVVNMRKIEVLV